MPRARPIVLLFAVLLFGCARASRPSPPPRSTAPPPHLFTKAEMAYLLLRPEDVPEMPAMYARGVRESLPLERRYKVYGAWCPKVPSFRSDLRPTIALGFSLAWTESPAAALELVNEERQSVQVAYSPVPHDSPLADLGDHVWKAGPDLIFTRANLVCSLSSFSSEKASPRDAAKLRPLEEYAHLLARKMHAVELGHPEPMSLLPPDAVIWPRSENLGGSSGYRPWGERTVTLGVRVGETLPRALPGLAVKDDYFVPLASLLRILHVRITDGNRTADHREHGDGGQNGDVP